MKTTKEQVTQIFKLSEEGMFQKDIAEQLGIQRSIVAYYLNRENIIRRTMERFRNKTLEERRIIYKKYSEYQRNYRKKRYNEDEAFRTKVKGHSLKWHHKNYKSRKKEK